MKVSYEESLANSFGLQRRGGSGNRSVLSVRAKGNVGQPLNSDGTLDSFEVQLMFKLRKDKLVSPLNLPASFRNLEHRSHQRMHSSTYTGNRPNRIHQTPNRVTWIRLSQPITDCPRFQSPPLLRSFAKTLGQHPSGLHPMLPHAFAPQPIAIRVEENFARLAMRKSIQYREVKSCLQKSTTRMRPMATYTCLKYHLIFGTQ